jgi:hypothetical protein
VPYVQRVRDCWVGLGVLLLLLAPGLTCGAQNVSEDQVKAAYVYNFAKFVEWPARDFAGPTAPLRFCVLDDPSFESELIRIVKDKSVAGHPVIVVPIQEGDQSRDCHLLFIGSSRERQIRRIIEALRETNVLTVSETKGFVEAGGIINFVLQDDRVQFEVNHKAAKQAGLNISARLLAVAKVIVE